MRNKRKPMVLRQSLLALALAVTAGQTIAQAKPEDRERIQLRRMQAALQESQAHLAALQAEKAGWQRDKETHTAELQRSQAGARGLQAQQEQAQRQLEQLRQQLAQAGTTAQQTQAAAGEREAALQQQLLRQQREVAELRQGNAALAGLLERKTQALVAAEARNRELHGLGMEAVDRWLAKTPGELNLQREPLLGWGAVRAEDRAEALRARIDAQRQPPGENTAAAPSAAGAEGGGAQ